MDVCPNCEHEVKEEDCFCPACGLNIKDSVIDEQSEEEAKEKNKLIMRKLAKFTFNELLNRGVPPAKINVIREDLKSEFFSGELAEMPILIKDCAFQYVYDAKNTKSEKKIMCALSDGRVRCVKEICPHYRIWRAKG